jgi:hypothetical protein
MKTVYGKLYSTANMIVGIVALHIISYGYAFYARVGNFTAQLLPKKRIAHKVKMRNNTSK